MKKQNTEKRETAPIDEVIEQYGLLRVWHKTAYIVAIVLMCCMAGFVVWGIFLEALRWIMIPFGIIMGICGVVLWVMMHRIYIKTGTAILDYFRAAGMSEADVVHKAYELKIPIKEKKADKV